MPIDQPWVDRAKRAHVNAIENLVVFAPLVLTAAIAGVSTPATVASAYVYVIAHLAHYVIYAAAIPCFGRSHSFSVHARPSSSRSCCSSQQHKRRQPPQSPCQMLVEWRWHRQRALIADLGRKMSAGPAGASRRGVQPPKEEVHQPFSRSGEAF
jgi:hypothetical protein